MARAMAEEVNLGYSAIQNHYGVNSDAGLEQLGAAEALIVVELG
jgi:hypothetical protein